MAITIQPEATLAGLALAQPLATQFHRIAGKAETGGDAREFGGPVTPADETFAIWAPLFASSMIFSVGLARREMQDSTNLVHVEELASSAYLADALWSLEAQTRGLGWASLGVMAAATGSAVSALIVAAREAPVSQGMRFAADWIGGLAGWLSVALFANVETTLNKERGRPVPVAEDQRAALLVAGAGAATSAVALASRGNLSYAGVALWGLGGIALRARREGRRKVLVSALSGAAALTAATLAARALPGLDGNAHTFGKR